MDEVLQVFTFGLLVEMNDLFVEEKLADKRHCRAWSELEEETKFIAHVPSASGRIFTGLVYSLKREKVRISAEVWAWLSAKWEEKESLKRSVATRSYDKRILTCRMICCFGKTKRFFAFGQVKRSLQKNRFVVFCFAFAKATNHCAGQVQSLNTGLKRGDTVRTYLKVREVPSAS